jgi:post-segregation antitoxin (ccd killing protein)
MGKAELKAKVDAELITRAQAVGLSVTNVTEQSLRQAVEELEYFATYKGLSEDEKKRKWAADNAEAIEAHKRQIEQFGVFGEDLRTW